MNVHALIAMLGVWSFSAAWYWKDLEGNVTVVSTPRCKSLIPVQVTDRGEGEDLEVLGNTRTQLQA